MLTIIFAIDRTDPEVQNVVSKLKVKNRIAGEDNVFYCGEDKGNVLSCEKDKSDDSKKDGTAPNTIESVRTRIIDCIEESKEKKLQILFVSHNAATSDCITGTIRKETVFDFFKEICEKFVGDKEIIIKCYACQFFNEINDYFTIRKKLELVEEKLKKIRIFASSEFLTPNPFFSEAIIKSGKVSDKSVAEEEYLATLPVIPSSYYPSKREYFGQYFQLTKILSCFEEITKKAGKEINTKKCGIECEDGQIILTVKGKKESDFIAIVNKICDEVSIKEALDKFENEEERDLIKKILQTVSYDIGKNKFYFTLGKEILGKKFQWKFPKRLADEPEKQPIESERDFIKELSL